MLLHAEFGESCCVRQIAALHVHSYNGRHVGNLDHKTPVIRMQVRPNGAQQSCAILRREVLKYMEHRHAVGHQIRLFEKCDGVGMDDADVPVRAAASLAGLNSQLLVSIDSQEAFVTKLSKSEKKCSPRTSDVHDQSV